MHICRYMHIYIYIHPQRIVSSWLGAGGGVITGSLPGMGTLEGGGDSLSGMGTLEGGGGYHLDQIL